MKNEIIACVMVVKNNDDSYTQTLIYADGPEKEITVKDFNSLEEIAKQWWFKFHNK